MAVQGDECTGPHSGCRGKCSHSTEVSDTHPKLFQRLLWTPDQTPPNVGGTLQQDPGFMLSVSHQILALDPALHWGDTTLPCSSGSAGGAISPSAPKREGRARF
ncbi:unnamed protein product [Natator depressus]